jgi:predicted DNA-binding transcriptional regulator YafY
VDRFGTRDVIYSQDDDKHFTAVIHVSVSPQFYGWLCGFGNRVKILSPSSATEKFKQYLDKMRGMYE